MHRIPRSAAASLAVALLSIAASCGSDAGSNDTSSDDAGAAPDVSVVTITDQQHIEGPIEYDQHPPIGGNHNPVWQNCGVYREPIADENAVHSLEHGAVWITYLPDLDADQVATLEGLAANQTHVLVSPYPDQSRPVIATAWGAQKGFDGADDPGLAGFVSRFQEGPQTPEPGAPCSRGTGTPL
jgi:hypothetical protein